MKKSFKLIALFLAIVMLAVLLCSCRDLDEAKANRAFYSDDHTEIVYKGNVYRLLMTGCILIDNDYYSIKSRYASEKDVPVLLSSWYGDWISINEDETIIRTYFSTSKISDMIAKGELDYDSSMGWGDYTYYVREDKYDEAKESTDPL